MGVILYSTNCPKCKVLEAKLRQKNITFEVVNDVSIMKELNMTTAPCLRVDSGPLMNFKEAVDWANKQGVKE